MKYKDYIADALVLGIFWSFIREGSWPYCVALIVLFITYIAQDVLAGRNLKSQTKELIEKMGLMEERFEAVEHVAEDAKKRLTEANMAAGFKIGK